MRSAGSVPRPRVVLHGQTRKKLERKCRRAKDARLRTRYLIVLRAADGWAGSRIAGALGCGEATVSRVLGRWAAWGEAGLVDRREDNGQPKADEHYASWVRWLLRFTPRAFLHRRPTWTKALLIETASWYTGKRVSPTTMGRLLKRLKARRGRAKAVAPCPWPEARKRRRLLEIAALVATLPADEACVWEDECDIHLNPKIGFDWMLPGTQRLVETPGSNEKRYVAGAMDAATDRVVWVESDTKNSLLFIGLLKKLLREYPGKRVIHVILDNYGIHSSRQTNAWLAEHGQKFRLHFLPPYCPDDNRIERCVWRDLHQNVTVNHQHVWIEGLMGDVAHYLFLHNCRAAYRHRTRAASNTRTELSDLRPAI